MTGRPGKRTAHPYRDAIWLAQAACSGSDVEFVPLETDLRSELLAKAICSTCPVDIQCLDDAIATKADGIRGGRTETERKWMRNPRSTA